MTIVSAREFRSNQGIFLNAAKNGQPVLLKSRYGDFIITPANNNEESLTTRICNGLREIKEFESGRKPAKPARNFLDEL